MTDEEIRAKIEAKKYTQGYKTVLDYRDALEVARDVKRALQDVIDQQTIVIAQQNAKIYAYEAIIANSNFKAVLPKKGDK